MGYTDSAPHPLPDGREKRPPPGAGLVYGFLFSFGLWLLLALAVMGLRG